MRDPTLQTAGYVTWAIALAGLALSLFSPRGVQDWVQPILIAALTISAALVVTTNRDLSPALVRTLAATTLIGAILGIGITLALGGAWRLPAGAGFLVAGVILWRHRLARHDATLRERPGPGAVNPTYLAIVQRDRPDVLAALRRIPAEDVRLLMDRRQADRRAAPVSGTPTSPWAPAPRHQAFTERRRAERRRPLAATWQTMGFVIEPAWAPEG